MAGGFIIAGTDTDVGKTVFAAAMMAAGDFIYWKPVQCGPDVDRAAVQKLSGANDRRFIESAYVFQNPLSPHLAAELEDRAVDVDRLALPDAPGPLLVELAGGVMVPLTRDVLQIEMLKRWGMPVVLCARTGLGAINHTLLSVASLRAHDVPIHGLAFIGENNPDNMRTIADFSGVKVLGRLPLLEHLNPENLRQTFVDHFPSVIPRVEGSAA